MPPWAGHRDGGTSERGLAVLVVLPVEVSELALGGHQAHQAVTCPAGWHPSAQLWAWPCRSPPATCCAGCAGAGPSRRSRTPSSWPSHTSPSTLGRAPPRCARAPGSSACLRCIGPDHAHAALLPALPACPPARLPACMPPAPSAWPGSALLQGSGVISGGVWSVGQLHIQVGHAELHGRERLI